MARLQTQGTPLPPGDPATGEGPGDDLDTWFARRLQAQGIPVGGGGPPLARILAVVALVIALGGLWWALSSARSSDQQAPPPATAGPTQPTAPKGRDTGEEGGKNTGNNAISWRKVTVDVLNGFGGQGAATTASNALEAAGWKLGTIGDAGRDAAATYVVFAPGFRAQAKAVAKKLGLGNPVPIASAPGVPQDATAGVAIVLGPDGLP